MYKIKIIGSGQLGSRHLQALKAVGKPLDIQVIDPSVASLQIARERYDAIVGNDGHKISFNTCFDKIDATDVAIIATNSNVRRQAIENLFDVSKVKLLLLEKLLFVNRNDYKEIENVFKKSGVKAWVNCPMRVMPVYEEINLKLSGQVISYKVSGSQFGLVTNAIHYIDHVAKLSGCEEFTIDTSGLDSTPITSKRAGFLELNGTLVANFSNGSRCEIICYPAGTAPIMIEIFCREHRYLVRESEGLLWYSGESSNWNWEERTAVIPFQSQMTAGVVETLLNTSNCGLTPYSSSLQIHLQLLDPLLDFVRLRFPDMITYPFT